MKTAFQKSDMEPITVQFLFMSEAFFFWMLVHESTLGLSELRAGEFSEHQRWRRTFFKHQLIWQWDRFDSFKTKPASPVSARFDKQKQTRLIWQWQKNYELQLRLSALRGQSLRAKLTEIISITHKHTVINSWCDLPEFNAEIWAWISVSWLKEVTAPCKETMRCTTTPMNGIFTPFKSYEI